MTLSVQVTMLSSTTVRSVLTHIVHLLRAIWTQPGCSWASDKDSEYRCYHEKMGENYPLVFKETPISGLTQ